jgi:hypothetical protein
MAGALILDAEALNAEGEGTRRDPDADREAEAEPDPDSDADADQEARSGRRVCPWDTRRSIPGQPVSSFFRGFLARRLPAFPLQTVSM